MYERLSDENKQPEKPKIDFFKERINNGLTGNYSGLKNGFDRINKYIYGIQRSYYLLIGGLSGSAKTTLANYMLLNAIKDADDRNIPINVFYYSYEMDEQSTKANWLSTLIYQKHKKVVEPQTILGLGDNKLTNEQIELIRLELPLLNKIFDRINFRFESDNPTGIRKELFLHAATVGDFEYEEYGTEGKKKIKSYKLRDSNCYNIVVMDHMALMKRESGYNLKENIDKYSEYCIWL